MNSLFLDQEMPETPGPDWTCKHCGENYSHEKAFNYHLAFECEENPEKGTEKAKRKFERTRF